MKHLNLLPLNLQFFADNTENNETTETPAAEPKTTVTTPSNEDTPKQEPSNTIPYERFKAVNDAYKSFKSLGFDSADELKAQLAKLEALEKAEEDRKKAEMTEAERLKAEKEEAAKKAEEAAEQAKNAQETANKRILNTEIRSVARSLNANDPNDVLALLDTSNIEIDESGDVKGVEDAVKALKEAKPWMFKQPIGADAVGGGNPNKNPGVSELSAKEKELAELKSKALKDSRLLGKVTQLYNEILTLKSKNK